ncbi:hypothetical protein [Natrialba sp. SSL1]|uniref:hypothetical protein n=1 Tax=Natrialba sp. SSL1 TaxID=1869245 RepID=UPI0008F8D99F|nr:hypothetical protein [Natrialba sp. SSL1]OIB57432.1 hypothetical protein BBD46_11535 [Natrialba sp. SSL1]
MTIELTDREKSILACALAIGLVMGLWAGLHLLPAEALDVPTEERETATGTTERAAYLPVPRIFFAITVLAPTAAVWYSYNRLRDQPEGATDEDVQEAIADGGTAHD